ncbi:MAG: hypothetical protein ACRC2U_02155 [Aeromonas sp.]
MTQFLLIPMSIQTLRHDLARYRPATGNGRFVPTRMQLVLLPMLVRIAKPDWGIEMPLSRLFLWISGI